MRQIVILTLIITTIHVSCIEARPYELYVSPAGNDNNPRTADRPLATLQRANDILERDCPDADVVLYVISDRGRLEITETVWTYFNAERHTRITSLPDSIPAVFSETGYTGQDAFITFEIAKGEPSNIEISNISIENCSCRAFLFAGNRDDVNMWNGYNTISNCRFTHIGNSRFPERRVVYSVIGFVNSRNNIVRDCIFETIKNHTACTFPQKRIRLTNERREKKKYPHILEYEGQNRGTRGDNPNLPIIGIYFAHHCDSNQVIGNSFSNVKGDVVRVRNGSNNLLFAHNTVVVSGWDAAITSWSREGDERPSRGMVIWNNTFIGNWMYGEPRVFKDKNHRMGERTEYDYGIIMEDNVTREYGLSK